MTKFKTIDPGIICRFENDPKLKYEHLQEKHVFCKKCGSREDKQKLVWEKINNPEKLIHCYPSGFQVMIKVGSIKEAKEYFKAFFKKYSCDVVYSRKAVCKVDKLWGQFEKALGIKLVQCFEYCQYTKGKPEISYIIAAYFHLLRVFKR